MFERYLRPECFRPEWRAILRAGLLLFLSVLLAACASRPPHTVQTAKPQASAGIVVPVLESGAVLRVATLNLAHGRKDAFNQLFLSTAAIRQNLSDIAQALQRYQPAVVALQEADAVSWWSGRFDHVDAIATEAGYPWQVHADNVDGWFSTFGTALLSRLPLFNAVEHTFASSPPTLSKGMALASIQWPAGAGDAARTIDLVSVHLDFSRRSVREAQILEMKTLLAERNNPTIIMGDFNSEWFNDASVIKALADHSRFGVYAPEALGYASYKDKRLDWILISRDLQFVSYRMIDKVLSDHTMLVAEIRFREPMEMKGK